MSVRSSTTTDAAVAELGKSPNNLRRFTIGYAEAVRRYRMPTDVLDALMAQGFYGQGERDALFDRFDLMNVALDLHLKCVWTMALRLWGEALDSAVAGHRVVSTVDVKPQCSRQHTSRCQFSVCLTDGWQDFEDTPTGVVTTLTVTSRNDWPDLPAEVRELIDCFRDLRFVRLPSEVAHDLEFTRSTNLADCTGSSTLLLAEGERRGLPVRPACGLVLSPPFSAVHYWVEVRVEDVFVPLDPYLIRAMLRWQLISADYWHEYRSTGPVLANLATTQGPLAYDHGVPVAVSYPTRAGQQRGQR